MLCIVPVMLQKCLCVVGLCCDLTPILSQCHQLVMLQLAKIQYCAKISRHPLFLYILLPRSRTFLEFFSKQ